MRIIFHVIIAIEVVIGIALAAGGLNMAHTLDPFRFFGGVILALFGAAILAGAMIALGRRRRPPE
jgi:hypothetical protein